MERSVSEIWKDTAECDIREVVNGLKIIREQMLCKNDTKPFLNTEEAAKFLRLKKRVLYHYMQSKDEYRIPHYVNLGDKYTYFKREELIVWECNYIEEMVMTLYGITEHIIDIFRREHEQTDTQRN